MAAIPERYEDWAENSFARLWEQLRRVPLDRIAVHPAPGTATLQDLLTQSVKDERLYELVDGVLVEKGMGLYQSVLAGILIQVLRNFLASQNLGTVGAPDGGMRLLPGTVRLPDVSFISWKRLSAEQLKSEPYPAVAPDLAVEIMSGSNTEAEMDRKWGEYFAAGTQLVWQVYPETRRVRVYTAPETFTGLSDQDAVEGGDVLPGFRFSIHEWFAAAEQPAPGASAG